MSASSTTTSIIDSISSHLSFWPKIGNVAHRRVTGAAADSGGGTTVDAARGGGAEEVLSAHRLRKCGRRRQRMSDMTEKELIVFV